MTSAHPGCLSDEEWYHALGLFPYAVSEMAHAMPKSLVCWAETVEWEVLVPRLLVDVCIHHLHFVRALHVVVV